VKHLIFDYNDVGEKFIQTRKKQPLMVVPIMVLIHFIKREHI